MKVHEQAHTAARAASDAATDLRLLRARVLRKMAATYPDGSRDNQVNADTDVLPDLERIIAELSDAIEAVGWDN